MYFLFSAFKPEKGEKMSILPKSVLSKTHNAVFYIVAHTWRDTFCAKQETLIHFILMPYIPGKLAVLEVVLLEFSKWISSNEEVFYFSISVTMLKIGKNSAPNRSKTVDRRGLVAIFYNFTGLSRFRLCRQAFLIYFSARK